MKIFVPITIIITTLTIQLSSGLNYVIFPQVLSEQGYSNTFVGFAMSFEIVSTLILYKKLSEIVKKLGVVKIVIFASLARSLSIYFLAYVNHYALWLSGIFIYGLMTTLLLVVLSTWLNMVSVGKLKGFIIGLYSSALSCGIALGPVVYYSYKKFASSETEPFWVNALIALIPILILSFIFNNKPSLESGEKVRFKFIFRHAKAIMLSAFVGGICFFGLPSFLVLYGTANGLTTDSAGFLLTMFMLGSVSIGLVVSSLSSFFDKRLIILVCVSISSLCAVFLSLSVYTHLYTALALMFLWGGCMGGIYATGMSFIGERFRTEDQVSANMSYVLMDSVGGLVGLCIIGGSMDLIGAEGLSYTVVIFSTTYLLFILSRHKYKSLIPGHWGH